MEFKLTQYQIVSIFLGIGILILSVFLLVNTNYILPSFILFISCILVLLAYSIKVINKYIYFFSPILQTLYCILFYIVFSGLYYYSKYNTSLFLALPSQNEVFLISVNIMYFIFILSVILPYLLFKFSRYSPKVKLKFFTRNFNLKKIFKYMLISQIFLIFLLYIIIFKSGYTLSTVFFHLSNFRYEYNHGMLKYLQSIFYCILSYNLILVGKIYIVNNVRNIKKLNILFLTNILLFIFWALISGARGPFLTLFLFIIYIYTLKRNLKISMSKLILMLLCFIFVLIFMAFYHKFSTMSHLSATTINLASNTNVVTSTLERVDAYSNSVKYLNYIDKHYGNIWNYSECNFLNQIYSQFTTIIPRDILPTKGDLVHTTLTKIIYPDLAASGKIQMLFGGFANLFYTGGIAYIVIDALIFGFIIAIMELNFTRYVIYDAFAVNYILLFLEFIIYYFAVGHLNSHNTPIFILKCIVAFFLTSLLSQKHKGENNYV